MTTTTAKGFEHAWASGDNGWGAGVNKNFRLSDAGADLRWAFNPEDTSGLAFHYYGGPIVDAAGATTEGSGSNVVLTDDATNWIERTHAGVVSANTSGWTTGRLAMYKVDTASGVIDLSTLEDHRVGAHQVPTGLPPSGAAGGVLGGTYPNPSFASDMATQAELDAAVAALKDGVDTAYDTLVEIAATLTDHSARHENGGADEISVAGLSGLLADEQTPLAHDASKVTSGVFVDARLASSNDAGNSSTAQTIDWANGRSQKSTLTGNVTYTFSNPVAGATYVLRVHTGAGSFTATWPATVKWPSGTAPTVTTTASRLDVYTFHYDGSIYIGVVSGQNYTP